MPTINKPKKKPREFISDKRKERQFIYQRPEWRSLRVAKFSANPTCERCWELYQRVTPTEEIHHIQSFMKYQGDERWNKAFDINNLMSLCGKCHSDIHKNDKHHER